ncbi:hypothetical protein [Klebsiella variicola]|uniref:hypothetical protein n=1 Tax=Klebsiella variicola TaxID=244366 RepID=UPI002B059B52|nr:hypothetical protein [Klebsiella variicola]
MGNNATELAADEELPATTLPEDNAGNYQPKQKRPYDKILTDISEEDLQSPGVYKLILAKSSELEFENYELKKNDSDHRKLEVKHATVSAELAQLKSSKKAIELLYSASLGTGTCLVGLSFSIYSAGSNLGGWVVGGVGIALSGVAIVVTLMDKK